MKINRKVELDIIIDHFKEQKWYQDEIAKIKEMNAKEEEIWKYIRDRESEWNHGTLADKRNARNRILKEAREAILGGDA